MVTTLTEKVYVPVKEHPDVSIYVISIISRLIFLSLSKTPLSRGQDIGKDDYASVIKNMMHQIA